MKQLKIAAITPNKKHDYLVTTILQGLLELGHIIKVTDPGNSINEYSSDGEFIEFAKSADCILSFFGKVRCNSPPRYYLLDKINRWDITSYIDGSEWTYTGYPSANQVSLAKNDPKFRKGFPWINQNFKDKCAFYFKRECYPDDELSGIIPLPFASINSSRYNQAQYVEKKYDVFCGFGQINDGLRSDVESFLRSWKTSFSIKIQKGVQYTDYIKTLAQSKIAIDAWGGGDCCARFWEIAINNTCLAYQKYNIVIPHPYTDLENCIMYSTVDELRDKLSMILNDDKKLNDITSNCYNHTLQYHTAVKRAEFMLSKIYS